MTFEQVQRLLDLMYADLQAIARLEVDEESASFKDFPLGNRLSEIIVATEALKKNKRLKEETFIKRGRDLLKLGADFVHDYRATKPQEMKQETEIKPKEKPKSTPSKKATENKGEQLAISIRGGARKGAGRKSLGVKKPVSIVLEQHEWDEIDSLIQSGDYKSYSDYFRQAARVWMAMSKGE